MVEIVVPVIIFAVIVYVGFVVSLASLVSSLLG